MSQPARYAPNWESLSAYQVPEWFKDAKLGIFIHWGVYSVPAFGSEWYPRKMYLKGEEAYEHHRAVHGDHKTFGYKDFIKDFTGKDFDASAWSDLFKKSGARYVVPVAEHHDGFPLYDCSYTRWNATQMGPKRDVIAELKQATEDAGMYFGVSSHRAFNWRFFTIDPDFDNYDPAYAGLYGPRRAPMSTCSEWFLEDWWARTKELVTKFEPDILWFDFGWHEPEFAPYWPRTAAFYYNQALDWGKEVVLQFKDKFPADVAVFDMERGKLNDIREHYWQTDTAVSSRSWGYIEDDAFKPVTTLVHDLVDIVSKNGNLLLNVGPDPAGVIPDEAAACLLGLGEWLDVNGEAIYGTRHWTRYGEGETRNVVGHLSEKNNPGYVAGDLRFTQTDDALYVILLWDAQGQVTMSSLGNNDFDASSIQSVSMLGHDGELAWSQDAAGLTVTLPERKPGDHAWTIKLAKG